MSAVIEGDVSGQVLAGRYALERELGRGSQGRTLLARDLRTSGLVAIKVLSFGEMQSWKVLELFEREVSVLQRISHAAVPRYLDSFHSEKQGDAPARYYLVQEYIEGQTLKEHLGAMRHFGEREVRALVVELLEVLAYLQGLSPPVIHRDVKPSNIMVRAGDGRLALIDFGAVRSRVVMALSGSTIVGTSGYMAPEQLMGRAVPASDLYGVGATAVHLLSQRDPVEIPTEGMRLLYRAYVNVSDEFAGFLDRLLAPHVEDRFGSAQEALDYLARGGGAASLKKISSGSVSSGEAPVLAPLAERSQLVEDSGGGRGGGVAFGWSEEEKRAYIGRASENYFVHELLMPRTPGGEVVQRDVAEQHFRVRRPRVGLARHAVVGVAFWGGIFAGVVLSHSLIIEAKDGGRAVQDALWWIGVVLTGGLFLNEWRVLLRVGWRF